MAVHGNGGQERPHLVIGTGGFAGTHFELTGDEVVIGRNPDTDVTLLDDGLSREHAVILRDLATGTFHIEDLQSSNGTKVNGKRVRSAELCHGDEIQLGRTVFHFVEPGLPCEFLAGLTPRTDDEEDDEDTQAL